MADAAVQNGPTKQDADNARNFFATMRAGLGLAPVDPEKTTLKNVEEVLQALSQGFDAKVFSDRANKTRNITSITPAVADYIHEKRFETLATLILTTPSIQAAPQAERAFKAMVAQNEEVLSGYVANLSMIRKVLDLPEIGPNNPLTVAMVNDTVKKLDVALNDPKKKEALAGGLKLAIPQGVSFDKFIENTSKSIGYLVAAMQESQSPATAPATASTPTRVEQPVARQQATEELLALRLAMGKTANPKASELRAMAGEIGENPNVAAMVARLKAAAENHPKKETLLTFATEAGVKGLISNLGRNVAAVTTPAGAPATVTAQTPAAPSAPAPDQSRDIRLIETVLTKVGISVGKVDGVRDADFDRATTGLKNMIAGVAGINVGAGGVTPADADALKAGIAAFVASQDFKDLQGIRKGIVPDSLLVGEGNTARTGIIGTTLDVVTNPGKATTSAGFKGKLLSLETEAERLEFSLNAKAQMDEKSEDPKKRELAAAIKRIPPHIMANMPAILDVLAAQGNALADSLKVVYTPMAAPASGDTRLAGNAPAAVTGATTAAPAATPTAPQPSSTAGRVADPAPSTADEAKRKTELMNADIQLVEGVLFEKIMPKLGQMTGMIGKFVDAKRFMPTISQDQIGNKDEQGNQIFDVQSQRMTATLIMGLKELAGMDGADGTYNRAIGRELQFAILTDDKFKMIRTSMELRKFSPEEAKIVMENLTKPESLTKDPASLTDAQRAENTEYLRKKKIQDEAMALKALFDSLDRLEKEKKLLNQQEAATITKGNMMLDAAGAVLDKFPKLKAMIVNFLQKTQIGQMIAGVMGMMGMDVERLWKKPEERRSPEQVEKDSVVAVSSRFGTLYQEAQAQLGPNAVFKDVMAKTKENITKEMDSWVASTTMKMLLPNGSEDDIKKLVQNALKNAEATGNFEAAQRAFTRTLEEGSKQWKKDKKLDFAAIEEKVKTLETTAPTVQREAERQGFVPPTPSPTSQAPAPAAQPSSTAGRTSSPAATVSTPQDTAPAGSELPALAKGQMRFTVGEQVVTLTPGNAGTETGQFRQGAVRLSNGRMQSIAEVIYNNFDALKIEGIKKEQLLGRDGKPSDGATHAVVQAMTELSVRAQVRLGPTAGTDKIETKLNHVTINQFAIGEMMHVGVDPAAITKAKAAVDAMAHDHGSFRGKPPKAPAGGHISVLEQTFAGYAYSAKVEDKPKPAPVVAQQPATTPVAPAAPAVTAQPPKGPYDGIAIDPKDAALFDSYKARNALKGSENCEPLFFLGRVDPATGRVISKDQDAAAGSAASFEYKAFVGLVDQKAKKFEVLEIGGAGLKNYVENRQLPDFVANKIIDNYTIRIKQNGADVDVGMDKSPTAEQRPLVIAEIKKAIDCALGLKPELQNNFTPAAAQPAQQTTAPAAVVPASPSDEERRRALEAQAREQAAATAKQAQMERDHREMERQRGLNAEIEAARQRQMARLNGGTAGQFNDKSGADSGECTRITRGNNIPIFRFLGAGKSNEIYCSGVDMGVAGRGGNIAIVQRGFSNTATVTIGGVPIVGGNN